MKKSACELVGPGSPGVFVPPGLSVRSMSKREGEAVRGVGAGCVLVRLAASSIDWMLLASGVVHTLIAPS